MSGSPSSSGAPAGPPSGTESGGETSVYPAPEFPGTPLYRASSSHQVGDPSLDGEGAYLIPFIAGGQSLEMFLTPAEKVNFTEWIEPDQDYSFLTKWGDYTGVFDMIMPHVPDFIAPNAISLLALLAVVQNWYIVQQYDNKDFESLQSVSTIVSLSLYYFAHCIHKRHAERLMNDTPLTYLFKHICDVLALVFIVSAVSQMFCGNERDVDMEMQWIAVHSCQLILFYKHLSAYAREAGVRYFWFIGPGEMVCVCVLCLMVKATFGLDWLIQQYLLQYQAGHDLIVRLIGLEYYLPSSPYSWISEPRPNPITLMKDLCVSVYGLTFVAIIGALFVRQRVHNFTKMSVVFILTYRMIPTFLRFLIRYSTTEPKTTFSAASLNPAAPSILLLSQHIPKNLLTSEGIIVEAMFMTVVTCDIIVAKMAKREVHPWLLLMCFSHLFPYTHMGTLFFTFFYYAALLTDLCWHMNLPLLANVKNVYCDGVFDLCHVGHKNLFRSALRHGNRLFVGVCGDADCANYKRPPIMSHNERCREIMGCKAVTRVIPNAPCFGLTKEFLRQNRIHIVCCGLEYIERYPDPKDDPYYRVPREMGIARPLPRYKLLSTSDLIKRIQSLTTSADDRKDVKKA
mmetsp:Transcript_16391/g.40479  ORF Transcript_16391/g.40479 Transcript_16391/m.40479 type:complete len:625 (-) Transcript_16391:808-2682(-)